MNTVRILITGSRTWGDLPTIRDAIADAITEHPDSRIVIVHGKARNGADAIAAHLARHWGPSVSEEPHPARWELHGSRCAGKVRNAEMVEAGADICLAFLDPCANQDCRRVDPHDSHGAAGCAELADAAGIPVRRYRREPTG